MTLPHAITTSSGLLLTDAIWNEQLKENIENLDNKLDGDTTLDGFPVTPSALPDADYEVSNKKYVDDSLTSNVGSGGWVSISTIPTRQSADDPTFVLRFAADMTSILGVGSKIKFTQNSATVYCVVTAVGSFTGGNTDITVYGGNSYDILDTSSYPITAVYYSRVYAPLNFPLERSVWDLSSTFTLSQSPTSVGTWYNSGSFSLPIGDWTIKGNFKAYFYAGGGGAGQYACDIAVTISSANNTESDSTVTKKVGGQVYESTGYTWNFEGEITLECDKTQAAKQSWYINAKTDALAAVGISLNATSKIICRFNYV